MINIVSGEQRINKKKNKNLYKRITIGLRDKYMCGA